MASLLNYVDNKTLRNSGILFGVIVVFLFIFLFPTIKNSGSLAERSKQLSDNFVRSKRKIQDYDKLKKELADTKGIIDSYNSSIAESDKKTVLIGEVSDLAKRANVKVLSIKPKPYTDLLPERFEDYFGAINYEFALECSYHDFGKFVNLIESFDYFLSINKFVIVGDKEKKNTLAIDLVITAYLHK